MKALRAVALDVSLLRRRRDLRLLTFGYAISPAGGEFTIVALAVQVYALTGSTGAVGLLGIAEFAPIVLLALLGGAFDRRRLILGAEAAAMLVSIALVVNAAAPHPLTAVLYVAAALFAAANAVLRPPLDALLPRVVERDELKAATAVNWSSGPTLGNTEAGIAARAFGLRESVVLGGALCVAGSGVLAVLLPRLWSYDSRAAASDACAASRRAASSITPGRLQKAKRT